MPTPPILSDFLPLLIGAGSFGFLCFLVGFFTAGLFATRPRRNQFRHRVFDTHLHGERHRETSL